MLHLFNIFHENKDFDNCAKVLEEECIRMFGTKSLNDEHDCNVISMNSLNIHLYLSIYIYIYTNYRLPRNSTVNQ